MNCPECGAENMRTVETFKTPEVTYRAKRCRGCNWSFTSHEVLSDEFTIPQHIRDVKRKNKHERLALPINATNEAAERTAA